MPLLFPPFTVALLRRDIVTLHHDTQRCRKNHTRQQALLAQGSPKSENWNKSLNSWELGFNHDNVCVCVTNKTLNIQRKESHYITTKNHTSNPSEIKHPYSTIKHTTKTHNPRGILQDMWHILRKKQNPYLYLKIGEGG